MTPHKASNGRGTFLLDRRFSGAGRIRTASGTKSARTFKAINRMLDDCYEAGLLSVLQAIGDGTLPPLLAYDHYRRGGVRAIPDAPSMRELQPMWEAWQLKTPNPSTRRERANAWKRLVTLLPTQATVVALPAAVMRARTELETHAPAFNRLRSAALAFLRDTVGRRHASYLEVTGIPGLKEVVERRSAPTPEQAMKGRNAMSEPARSLWWSLVTTGMGLKEMDGPWSAGPVVVTIEGTKRKDRHRIIPNIANPVRRDMGWKQFRAILNDMGWQVYDARRAFAHLLEEAGVPRTRRKMYMGHAAGDVTAGYETAELLEYVAADRLKVLERLAIAEARVKQGVKEGLKRA